MLDVNFNELAALQLILRFISVKELISCAMQTLAERDNVKSKDNATVCFNAIEAFLK